MHLNRKSSHTQFDLKYHLIWTTKYRKPILTNKIGTRVRDLIREICTTHNIEIIRGHVSKDHIHIFISSPPQISVSKITQYIKGKTSRKLMQEFPPLSKQFWGQHLWGRGYYAVSSGNITDELIMEYIESQDEDSDKRGDSFTVIDVN
jgi:putative transposase